MILRHTWFILCHLGANFEIPSRYASGSCISKCLRTTIFISSLLWDVRRWDRCLRWDMPQMRQTSQWAWELWCKIKSWRNEWATAHLAMTRRLIFVTYGTSLTDTSLTGHHLLNITFWTSLAEHLLPTHHLLNITCWTSLSERHLLNIIYRTSLSERHLLNVTYRHITYQHITCWTSLTEHHLLNVTYWTSLTGTSLAERHLPNITFWTSLTEHNRHITYWTYLIFIVDKESVDLIQWD